VILQSIESLNSLPPNEFAEAVHLLFEAAPPLADALYAARPFASFPALIDTAETLAASMPFDDQVRVLFAHPRIGADLDTLSAASYREQGNTEPAHVYSELAQLNDAYEQRFGFRFVVFVNRRPKSEIVEVLRTRLANSPEDELRTGLHDMFLIARDRLASA
jgi:2-oxo-4-hydroxy-4-carboxy--5-ureidoimidazoline (OHCU) decarboxylase